MNPPDQRCRSLEVPDAQVAEGALADAQWLFRRTLAAWASDTLVLRRAGLGKTTWTSPAPAAWRQAA